MSSVPVSTKTSQFLICCTSNGENTLRYLQQSKKTPKFDGSKLSSSTGYEPLLLEDLKHSFTKKKHFHVEKKSKIKKGNSTKPPRACLSQEKGREKKTQQSKLNAGNTDSLNLKEHGASGG